MDLEKVVIGGQGLRWSSYISTEQTLCVSRSRRFSPHPPAPPRQCCRSRCFPAWAVFYQSSGLEPRPRSPRSGRAPPAGRACKSRAVGGTEIRAWRCLPARVCPGLNPLRNSTPSQEAKVAGDKEEVHPGLWPAHRGAAEPGEGRRMRRNGEGNVVLASTWSPSSPPAGPPLNPGVLSTSGQYRAHASPCWALGDREGPFQGGSPYPAVMAALQISAGLRLS